MAFNKDDELDDLSKIQDKRRKLVDKFVSEGSKSGFGVSYEQIETIVDQIIFDDQMQFLSMDNELDKTIDNENQKGNELEQSVENEEGTHLEKMDLTPEQVDILQKEFDKIMQELFTLLAEIGGLLNELGSPPDPQKLALLKEKMQLLRALRSKMMRFSLAAGPKYQKVFNVKHYVQQLQNFVNDNKDQIKQLGIDANLESKDSIATKKLEKVMEKQKTLESLLEQVDKLEKDLQSEKDPKKIADLAIQIEKIKERILILEKEIKEELEASFEENIKGKEKGNSSEKSSRLEGVAAAEELDLEEAAASMFAELNGLINGQRFGQYQLLANESMNVHKTFDEVIDDFAIGGQEVENIRESDVEKTSTVENVVKAGAGLEAAKDVTGLVDDVVSSTMGIDSPIPKI